jgi:hypothetical protein
MRSFCALPENIGGVGRGQMRQWRRDVEIGWAVRRPVAGFALEEMESVILTAMELWEAVSGVKTVMSPTGSPNIIFDVDRIDGRNGVLAQAELPQPNQTRGTLRCWFDVGEHWVLAKNPPPGKMDLLRVACHEIGHNLGMGHAPRNSQNLMAPSVSGIREPMPDWDIPQVVARYGETSVDPPTDPDGGNDDDILIECLREFLGGFSHTERKRIARQLSDIAKDVLLSR